MAKAWSLQTAGSGIVVCSCLTSTPKTLHKLADPHQAEVRLTLSNPRRESKRNKMQRHTEA